MTSIYRWTIVILAAALLTVSLGYAIQRRELARQEAALHALTFQDRQQESIVTSLHNQISVLAVTNQTLRERITVLEKEGRPAPEGAR